MFEIDCVIIAIVTNIGATQPGCSLSLCVCKSKTTACCMNHEIDLDYIPQLPSSVKTLVFVNNYLPQINRETFVNVTSNDINRLNLTQNRIQTISNDSFLDLSHTIDIHLDTLQACFASIHFVHEGSMYVRNVFRSGTIPQDMFQHFSDSYLWFID